MKKYYIRIFSLLLILFLCHQLPAQWNLKTNTEDGKYSLVTNSGTFFGVSGGNILTDAVFALLPSDTSTWRLVSNTENGLYSLAENKISYMGIDSGKIKTKAVFILNPPSLSSLGLDTTRLAYLNKSNSFIGRVQAFDTINATARYLLNGVNINTAGTLSNVAYLDQSNTFTGNLVLSAPSLTGSSSASALNITQTWNTSGTPTAILMNITNTASNSFSKLLDLKINGTSKFAVDRDGLIMSNGSYFGGYSSGVNLFYAASAGFAIYNNTGGTKYVDISNSTGAVTFTPLGLSGSGSTSAFNLTQTWNTSGTPTALTMNITNTSSGAASLLMDLQVNNGSMFSVRKDGRVNATSLISASDVIAGPNNGISFTGRGGFGSSSTSTVYAYGNPTLSMFGLGGYSSSFPGIGISGTTVQIKLADGSAFTDLEAGNVKVSGNHLPLILNTSSLGSSSLYFKTSFTNNTSVRDTTLTASATLTSSFPEKILIDATSGNITLTLPNDATLKNYNFRIKRIDNSGNTVTLSTGGTIDDNPTKSISYNSSYAISCTGSGVYKIF